MKTVLVVSAVALMSAFELSDIFWRDGGAQTRFNLLAGKVIGGQPVVFSANLAPTEEDDPVFAGFLEDKVDGNEYLECDAENTDIDADGVMTVLLSLAAPPA